MSVRQHQSCTSLTYSPYTRACSTWLDVGKWSHIYKNLGFLFYDGLDKDLLMTSIAKTLEDRLNKAHSKKTSLIGWVVIINHLSLGTLWFMLCLWIGDPEVLKAIEKVIFQFLWVEQLFFARHRVDFLMVTLPKHQGGLGLLFLSDKECSHF